MGIGGYSWMVHSRLNPERPKPQKFWGPNTPQGITKSSKYRALKIALPHIVGGLLGVVGPSLVVADIRRNN